MKIINREYVKCLLVRLIKNVSLRRRNLKEPAGWRPGCRLPGGENSTSEAVLRDVVLRAD